MKSVICESVISGSVISESDSVVNNCDSACNKWLSVWWWLTGNTVMLIVVEVCWSDMKATPLETVT